MNETLSSPKVEDALRRVIRAVDDAAVAKSLSKKQRVELFDQVIEYAREARAELSDS